MVRQLLEPLVAGPPRPPKRKSRMMTIWKSKVLNRLANFQINAVEATLVLIRRLNYTDLSIRIVKEIRGSTKSDRRSVLLGWTSRVKRCPWSACSATDRGYSLTTTGHRRLPSGAILTRKIIVQSARKARLRWYDLPRYHSLVHISNLRINSQDKYEPFVY